MRPFRPVATAAVLLAVAGVSALPAHAAAPPPVPCAAQLVDPDADFEYTNRDLLGAFFRTDGDQTSLNMIVKEITFAEPTGAAAASAVQGQSRHEWNEGDSMNYRGVFTVGGKRWYAQASAIAGKAKSTVAFEYGTVAGMTATRVGTTTGVLRAGKNAVVTVALPAEIGARPGVSLGQVVVADENVGNLPGGVQNREGGDVMPGGTHDAGMPTEAAGAPDVTLVDCAAAAVAPGAAPAVTAIAASVARAEVVAGRSTRLSATLTGATPGTVAELLDGADAVVATKAVRADGRVSFRIRPTQNTTYVIRAGAARSTAVQVGVAPRLRAMHLKRGRRGLVLRGSFLPADDVTVTLQRRLDGDWFDEARGNAAAGRFRIAAPRAVRGGAYRVVVAASAKHLAVTSRVLRAGR